MRNESTDSELRALLEKFDAAGGVLDYVFLERHDEETTHACHHSAALAGMAEIGRRIAEWASQVASAECPIEKLFRIRWHESELSGKHVSFSTFWGTDNVEPKYLGRRAWAIPSVDGYKTAFFHPPHSLGGTASEKAELFAGINSYVLGADPAAAEIFSWSTDWSNYFDAGHEWWGAFYWTIRPAGSHDMVVVAASSTD
jgi:hypothetical protein